MTKQIRDYVLEARKERTRKNETTIDNNSIVFDSFDSKLKIYSDVRRFGKNTINVGIQFSSGDLIYYNKPIKDLPLLSKSSKEDIEKRYLQEKNQATKDSLEILKALKPVCDRFDKEVKSVLKKYGYELEK